MGKLFTAMRNAPKRTSALFAMIAVAAIVPAALLAWGPDRPTFTIEKPAGYVTFNSITNNPAHGDERNFVQVKEASAGNESYAENAALAPGKEYTVFMYYHNNAATNLNASGQGIAKGTNVRAEIPAVVPKGSNGTKAVGYVNASNAQPASVWDDISFSNQSAGDIALRYVPGTATIHNRGAVNGAKLSDNIITSGATIGYDALNGDLPGCNEFSGYVTFNIKADQPNFEVSKQVRKAGATIWAESTEVKPGDNVEYLIGYKNTGTTVQNDVVVKDQLPTGMTYVNGTTQLKNVSFPDKKTVSDNLTNGTGVNIGNYTVGSNAYIYFTAKVKAAKELVCGKTKLVNTATIETNNGNKSDTADVIVDNGECEEPKKIQVCELSTKKIITIDEQNFDSSKHSKNYADCKENNPKCPIPGKEHLPVDSPECKETPVTPPVTPPTPPELPQTGPVETVLSVIGLGALIASIGYYINSRRAFLGR